MAEKQAILDAFESIDAVLGESEQTTHGRMGDVSFGALMVDFVTFWNNPNSGSRSELSQVIRGFLKAAKDPRPDEPSDVPYCNAKINAKSVVYLDGIVCSYCVEANAEEGWVKVIHRDKSNNIVYLDKAAGLPMTDTLRGHVTIRRSGLIEGAGDYRPRLPIVKA